MIEKMRLIDAIADAGIIEAIRANMPVATMEKAGLADVNHLKAFQFRSLKLKYGESFNLGKASGILVLRMTSQLHNIYIYSVDNFDESMTLLHGTGSLSAVAFTWEGEPKTYMSELVLNAKYGSSSPNTTYNYYVAWQTIGI